jgi:hypothetical protein
MTMTPTPKKKSLKSFDSYECDSDDEFQPETGRRSKGGAGGNGVKRRGRPPLHLSRNSECSTPKGKNRTRLVLSDDESEVSTGTQKIIFPASAPASASKKRSRSFPHDHDSGSEADDGQQLQQQNLFHVHTFSEWPGQAEGEPMDLPHIWNVISMMFPEDYSKEVLSFSFLSPRHSCRAVD